LSWRWGKAELSALAKGHMGARQKRHALEPGCGRAKTFRQDLSRRDQVHVGLARQLIRARNLCWRCRGALCGTPAQA